MAELALLCGMVILFLLANIRIDRLERRIEKLEADLYAEKVKNLKRRNAKSPL